MIIFCKISGSRGILDNISVRLTCIFGIKKIRSLKLSNESMVTLCPRSFDKTLWDSYNFRDSQNVPPKHPHRLRRVSCVRLFIIPSDSTRAILSASLATILLCSTDFKVFFVHCTNLSHAPPKWGALRGWKFHSIFLLSLHSVA